MAHYVVVRGVQSEIDAAASAADPDGTTGVGIAPVTAHGGEVVEIVSFADQSDAVAFSLNRPDWDGTVYDEQWKAEKMAIRRAEGH